MKLAIDLDGVLADASEIWIPIFQKRFNIQILKNQINSWNFWEQFGLQYNDFEEVFDEAWADWQNVKETENNISEKIIQLRNFGQVDLVTARNKKTMGFVNKWLEYKKIQLDNVIVVDANKSKAILDYNIFLDDSPIQVKQIAHSKKIALVYNQPWNREIKENNNIIRVKNLFDVILFVRKFVEDFK